MPFPAGDCKHPSAGVADRLRRTGAPCHRPVNCWLRHAHQLPGREQPRADSCSNAERSLDRSPSARRPIWSAKVSISSVHPHLPAIGSADTSSGASATAVDADERHGACSSWCAPRTMGIGDESLISTGPETVSARRGTRLLDHELAQSGGRTEAADADRAPRCDQVADSPMASHRRADDLSVPRWSKLPASAPSIETLARTACGPARLS